MLGLLIFGGSMFYGFFKHSDCNKAEKKILIISNLLVAIGFGFLFYSIYLMRN